LSAADGITVDLEGTALDPGAVSAAIEQVQTLVTSLTGAEAVQLTLTDLRGGSAHISMSVAGTSLDDISGGIDELRRGPTLPNGWTRPSLVAVVGLAKLTSRRGVDSISLRIGDAVASIDAAIQANAEKALAPSSESLGAMRGVLYRYSNDPRSKKRSAGLRRAETGDIIELRFTLDNAARVREHLEREVEVWGEIARDATGGIAHLAVEGIESVEPVGGAMTAADGRGLLGSDWTSGVDPADWVRTMRG
jgi:hypothetical protein